MPVTRAKKKETVEELEKLFAEQKAILFVDFSGLKTDEFLELKKKLKIIKAVFKVAKKTLMQLALKNKGEDKLADLVRNLNGQVAAVFSFTDEIEPSKTLYDFAKTRPETLKILGGFINGLFNGPENIAELAKLPSMNQLRARLAGALSSPLRGLAYVLGGNISKLLNVLSAIKDKKPSLA